MTTKSPLKRPDLHPEECRVPTQHKIDGRAGRSTPTLARRRSLREIGQAAGPAVSRTVARDGTRRPSLGKVGRSRQPGHQATRSPGTLFSAFTGRAARRGATDSR